MTVKKAKQIVKLAMHVIVNHMTGEPCHYQTSCQSLYERVRAVDSSVVTALVSDELGEENNTMFYYNLAKNIRKWHEENPSFLLDNPKPEKWMFKTF